MYRPLFASIRTPPALVVRQFARHPARPLQAEDQTSHAIIAPISLYLCSPASLVKTTIQALPRHSLSRR